MSTVLRSSDYTWVYALAGVFSILFGLVAIFWPSITLLVLVLLFGAFALVNGVLSLIQAYRAMESHRPWWPALLLGVIDIAAAVFVLVYPGITAVILLYAIAFWAIVIGLIEIVVSLETAEFILLVAGVLAIVFALILLASPVGGALALVVVIGAFAIVRGVVLLVHAFRIPGSATLT